MSALTIIFYSLEIIAGISAVCILFTKNVFYGALLLITCLLAVAGIYIVANAEFVAVTQILVYVGGVLVLIIFGVMLTSRISGKPLIAQNQYWLSGALVGLVFFVMLGKLFSETVFYKNDLIVPEQTYTSINQIGILFMTDYVLPFEIVALLLLVALIGAAVAASSFNSIKKS